ncbi:MAG: 2-oxoacid:acceptor oxidoreductase family protein, partial [Saprospiraceae bacterium]|nr:2-oxoacid:acceptor oxidoreductase family protein [Saprospiraceae bacterium]
MTKSNNIPAEKSKYPGKRMTADGNTLVAKTEGLISDAGVFYPITPSTQMGEYFQNFYAQGLLNAFGKPLTAIETEGEHAAQGGAIAMSITGKRTVNFTSGQGIVYGLEQYYHAPGKLSTMTLEVGSRALTKHALNVHCGHDDIYAAMDTGWTMLFAKTAQQAVDQAIIIRRVNELTLNPGMNIQDGFLTTHIERTFRMPEAALIREYLGAAEDIIDCPTEAQRLLFGPTRRRVPQGIDLKNPALLGPVQNQEHYMNGVAARRNNFLEDVLPFLEEAYRDYGNLTGRHYSLVTEYNCEKSDLVFLVLGSAAENIEAVSDYIRETRGEEIGVVHINVLRPFPEAAVIESLRGKKQVIILERTDEPLSGDNPLTRDVKTALSKAVSNFHHDSFAHLGKIDPNSELPDIFSGVYGLGSRDFRPEATIGAYDFALNRIARQDGKMSSDGERFFYLGIDHPYTVESKETPSCLPEHSIAVRFHSIGGWGMITTGKNLGAILGELSSYVAERDQLFEEDGELKEIVNISANPKYGSEKKGAPTNYFLVAAPERVRVNCDLQHVNVVLCCDPKIFLHANPLKGLEQGGGFVWESNETDPRKAWQRIPTHHRQEIIDRDIKIFVLNGFDIAKKATEREDLQTRMQGNSFLGAFFKVSSFLRHYKIPDEEFLETVEQQYQIKFGRFGEDVVASNMQVMRQGFRTVMEVPHGEVDDVDLSSFMGHVIQPCEITLSDVPSNGNGKSNGSSNGSSRAPLFQMSTFDAEFRSGLGYNQPSSALSAVGLMAAGTGATASKYVSRREIPIFLEENCTQCMDCITVCPDTALPNTAQDISDVLSTAIRHYVSDPEARQALIKRLSDIESSVRTEMWSYASDKTLKGDADGQAKFAQIVIRQIKALNDPGIGEASIAELNDIIMLLPIAYLSAKGIFKNRENKNTGTGGIFSIFVQDLCKGCGACVEACGSHEALVMVPETEEMHAQIQTATTFMNLLRDTPQKYLGIYDASNPQESKAAALKFHLMQQSKYNALVSGDGACAGCGEKSALRALATVTEALMRPIFHNKAKRLREKAAQLDLEGLASLEALQKRDEIAYQVFRRTLLHIVMGFGCEDV